MIKPVGGRGNLAPYKTVMVRVPEPIKARVEELKELFHSNQLEEYDKKILEDNRLANEYRSILESSKN
ncbi:MAG: hypothetical protein AAFY76_01355 [Cyanobacteria bacterium J06649_11]